MKKLTYKQVLAETVKFYSEDTSRRAKTNTGQCRYYISPTQQCAVGRYMKDPQEFEGPSESISGLVYVEQYVLTDILRDDVKHLDKLWFWKLLQNFHDTESNFEENKLSIKGKEEVKKIKEYIKENKLDG